MKFTGTAKQLKESVLINGKEITSVHLSILNDLQIIKVIGKEKKDPKTKGKAGNIFELQSSDIFQLSSK